MKKAREERKKCTRYETEKIICSMMQSFEFFRTSYAKMYTCSDEMKNR